jgi:hypothetical protein
MNSTLFKNNFFFFLAYALIAFSLTIAFLGLDNIFFNNVNWISSFGDMSNSYNAWTYYKNDIWRFPLGENPNYGIEVGTSIVFTDSIPLLAIFFKTFKTFLGNEFQYFSFWIYLCFLFQLFIPFLIIKKITSKNFFAIISSLVFLVSPIFLHRLGLHLALGGHWLILLSFYINYCTEKKNEIIYFTILICFSALIHAYLTVMIFTYYTSLRFLEFYKEKNFKNFIKKITLPFLFLLTTMYIVGYFTTSPTNSIARGYGTFNLDLVGIFDPQKIWSILIKDLPGTTLEGFNYLGLGNIFLILLVCVLIAINNYKNRNYFKVLFSNNLGNIFFSLILLCWALTTDLTLFGEKILSIELNKYIFGLLSIFGATGRFFWPIYYLLILFSLIKIFEFFKNKNISILVVCLVVSIQLTDISRAIKYYFVDKTHISFEYKTLNSNFWNEIPRSFKVLRTTYLFNNYGSIFYNLKNYVSRSNFEKTDITLTAAFDREKGAMVRYNLIDQIINKRSLHQDTAYVVDNLGHLRNMKYVLEDNTGYFFRDEIWVALPSSKNKMTIVDENNLKKIKPNLLHTNKTYKFTFKDRAKYLGFGWSHNYPQENGVWSEGNISVIMFRLKQNINKDILVSLEASPYIKNKSENYSFDIYLNDVKIKKIQLSKYSSKNFEFKIPYKLIKKNNMLVFKFKGLTSPFDTLQSPDARKLGFLLKSITLK